MAVTPSLSENRKLQNQKFSAVMRYVVLTLVAVVMLYPIIWLVGASFKENNEIFTSIGFIPKRLDFQAYIDGWNTKGDYTFTLYFINTFKYVVPKIIFTLFSATITAYGFARFEFPFKKIMFSLMMATMFLPQVVTRIPLYLFWKNLGLLDTYIPLIANSVFAQEPFFVFMMIQFLRSIPRDLDEAATIDGCGEFGILWRILVPALKPALISCVIFQFVWSFSDFLGPLIYITSQDKFPVSLALKLNIDPSTNTPWNQVFAMSLISLLPAIILFFSAQKYFVDGVTSSGIKG
ncbi:MAG: carbohydrate ABC transporter permease [Lactococcus sp.]|uniref:carbohydrate ABC transporter permease n=1 Tax=Pseudolactococcus TaxID=3436058 RepID=UPI0015DBE863|nr:MULTISPECIES: carbohydrate ABC transporter permease [Lactococcus]MCJ1969737.1 carbohydrate ABC transporter permease [Lactococcus carnosus]MCJ1973758.1 carbohydrate ABC transporter permease [Lactococcus carnosus]MCJ1976265.1 carbohydrate ABC transporter permease [Lactococcus carnosus]MCJ1986511.1 carbohydrate ABC transporter permease [Lactococcus carnosus]MCJ1988384.1 carbohydrate ABC transporter permease [Lactococcus carnosus]